MLSRRDWLEPRKAGLDMSNKIWGFNQSVRCVLDDEAQPVQTDSGDDENGEIST